MPPRACHFTPCHITPVTSHLSHHTCHFPQKTSSQGGPHPFWKRARHLSPPPAAPAYGSTADGSRHPSSRRCARKGKRTDMGQQYKMVSCTWLVGRPQPPRGTHFQPQPQLCTPHTQLARSMWPPQPPLSPPSVPKHAAVSTRYIHQLPSHSRSRSRSPSSRDVPHTC